MKVAIVGSGAIGLLYGGWLQSVGTDVTFVTRPQRHTALDGAALSATGPLPFRLDRVRAIDDVQKGEPFDIIVLSVKLYDLATAAQQAVPALAPAGVLVAVQNGINVYQVIRPYLEPSRIAIGPVHAATRLTGPTSVAYSGNGRVVLGNPEGPTSPLVSDLIGQWQKAGLPAAISDDINQVIWNKFLGLATNAALTSLGRLPAGILYHTPELIDLARQSIAEVARVGRAEGVNLTSAAEDDALATLQNFPAATVASMRQDLDAGKRLEVDSISGEIDRLGRKHGIATPLHSLAWHLLRPFRDGPPQLPASG